MSFVLISTLAILLSGGTAGESPPNLVVILIDDLGYSQIGPFGSKQNETPHLDRMAEQGMKFTSFTLSMDIKRSKELKLLVKLLETGTAHSTERHC